MTDKSVLVLVPRDLFEAVAYFDKGSRTVGELQLWAKDILMRHDNPIKTPAEDVRAVGEEPVAWRCGGITWSYRADAVNHAERFNLVVENLYRHPQRPVVFPEKMPKGSTNHQRALYEGWNACLDEFERLNK